MTLKLITNHQNRALVAIASGFAFMALGFALFLIGVDGAFQVQASGHGSTSISITASAPGILCFVLAAWLIYVGTTRNHKLNIPVYQAGELAVLEDSPSQTVQQIDAPKKRDWE